jgi:small subunit ribosomal protein S21
MSGPVLMTTTPESADQDAQVTEVSQTSQYEPVQGRPLEVRVDERGVERAIRKLRRLMASEGVLREIKRRRHHEKPSVKSKRKLREAERRRKRRERKLRSER